MDKKILRYIVIVGLTIGGNSQRPEANAIAADTCLEICRGDLNYGVNVYLDLCIGQTTDTSRDLVSGIVEDTFHAAHFKCQEVCEKTKNVICNVEQYVKTL